MGNTSYKKVLQKKRDKDSINIFLKTRTAKREAEYKKCKNMLQTIKSKSKRNYYLREIPEYKNNAKKHGIL